MLPRRQTGIVMTAMKVARSVRRKTNMMIEVRQIEAMMSQKTPFIELRINLALSETTTRLVPAGAVLLSSSMRVLTRRERSTSLAPFCLRTITMIVGLPS